MAYTDDRSPGSDEPQDNINPLALAAGLIRTDIVDEATAAKAWIEFTTLANAVKRRKAEIEADLLDYMTGANIKEISIGGGDDNSRYRIRVVKAKSEKWKVGDVFDFLGIDRKLIDVFSSPKFRKGELTILLGDRAEVDNFIDVTWSEDVEIKEIDTEAVKRFAR
jgi:hypothetical protein